MKEKFISLVNSLLKQLWSLKQVNFNIQYEISPTTSLLDEREGNDCSAGVTFKRFYRWLRKRSIPRHAEGITITLYLSWDQVWTTEWKSSEAMWNLGSASFLYLSGIVDY